MTSTQMNNTQLDRMAMAASIIRRVIGHDFDCEPSGSRQFGQGSVMIVMHPAGHVLRQYCNYDCYCYDKIQLLTDQLSDAGFLIEDCTGDYSAIYEA
jgi:hypothetical protein